MVGINGSNNLPPGFRFHPTDEELIVHYLRNQARSKPCPVSLIPEIDIYKFDPWELPEKAEFGENEWYFFTHRDRKYPNGVRPNRAAVSGYWKATGTDKAIYSCSKYVGVKKSLVFYKRRPPKGIKSDWIMHEYRLNESRSETNKQNGSMRLDDVVLCRIYKKKNLGRNIDQRFEDSFLQILTANDANDEPQEHKFPKGSLNHLSEFDYMRSIMNNEDNSYNVPFNYNQDTLRNNESLSLCVDNKFDHQLRQVQQPYTDDMKFQGNQQMFVNPVYEMQ